jgi:hypothetical protein
MFLRLIIISGVSCVNPSIHIYMAPLPGICIKILDVGQLSFFVKYDSYDVYESRKTSNQIIILTVCEMQCYIQ